MTNLFIYGSLMSKTLFEWVGKTRMPATKTAYVTGFMKITSPYVPYPLLVRGEKLVCSGLVMENVADPLFERLVHYEGDGYTTESVVANLVGMRQKVDCLIFVPHGCYKMGWDLEKFDNKLKNGEI
jgi:gamma-glutamylcyclotransferase (GGCT)/AIG2-like uncharacterized protein YtfP